MKKDAEFLNFFVANTAIFANETGIESDNVPVEVGNQVACYLIEPGPYFSGSLTVEAEDI